MQVYQFILDHRIGGPHTYVRSISQVLSPEVVFTIVTAGNGEATDLALTNLRRYFRLLYPLEVVWNSARLCWRFRTKKSRHDLIFNVHGAANIAPILSASLLGIPVVWHFHETVASFNVLVEFGKAALSRTVHNYVVVAEKSAEVFKLPTAELIPGAIDADFWKKSETDGSLSKSANELSLIAVGNLNPLKGMDILLEALGKLDVRSALTIVGARLQSYEKYAANLYGKAKQISGSVRQIKFAGWQSPEAVRSLLANAGIFVLPSRSEACPIALLEAMSMECVCIASDVGDVAKILNKPTMGIVIESESVAQLTEALEYVARLSPQARREMGRQARESVSARFSQTRMAKRHLEIYKNTLREAEEKK